MAEKENNGMYQHPMWSMHRFIILRIFLAVVILGIVFHVGMQIGELKGMVESGGYGGGYHQMFDRGMMGGNVYYKQMPVPAPATSAPATSTKSTTTTTTSNANK